MSDIEFLERNLLHIGEQRTPKAAVAISEVLGQFAKSGRAGSGAHAFHEREKIKAQFDECVKEMARFYVGFCERERLPLERHVDRLARAGAHVADEWSAMAQNGSAECSKQLMTIVNNIVKNAVRGYVGLDHVYKKPPSILKAVVAWAFDSTTKIVVSVIGALVVISLATYFHLR